MANEEQEINQQPDNASPLTDSLVAATSEETMQLGKAFAASIPPGTVVFLEGDLGAGKTTFVKGMAEAFDVARDEVSSPTFQYLNIYKGQTYLYHFDLYRLTDEASFIEMGFHELLEGDGVCCVEWSERLKSLRAIKNIQVTIAHEQEGRTIHICQN